MHTKVTHPLSLDGHSVTTIEDGAFEGNKITSLTLPDGIEYAGANAFRGNPLEEISIGGKLKHIHVGAFLTGKEALKVTIREIPPLLQFMSDALARGSSEESLGKILAEIFGRTKLSYEVDASVTDKTKKDKINKVIKVLSDVSKKIETLRTVILDANGGSILVFGFGEPEWYNVKIFNTYIEDGEKITDIVPAIKNPNYAGHIFQDWFEDKEGTINFNKESVIVKDLTLYAKWKKLPAGTPYVEDVKVVSTPQGSDSYYKKDEIIKVKVTFSESRRLAVYNKDASDGTPTQLIFEYSVARNIEDRDGIQIRANIDLNGGSIKAQGSNTDAILNFAEQEVFNHKIDSTLPTIRSVAFEGMPNAGQNNFYKVGDTIKVTVTFNEAVHVEDNGGANKPYIVVKFSDDVENSAQYTSGTGSTDLIFEYQVKKDDESVGIAIEANKFDVNGGAITDAAGNAFVDTTTTDGYTAVGTDTARKVDGKPPRTSGSSSFESVPASGDGYYRADEKIVMRLSFNEPVHVTGIDFRRSDYGPKIKIRIGTTQKDAYYQRVNTSRDYLLFEYTVKPSDEFDEDGIDILENSLDLNGKGIEDAAGNELTDDGFASMGFVGIRSDAKHKVKFLKVRSIALHNPPRNGARYTNDRDIQVKVSFSENIQVSGVDLSSSSSSNKITIGLKIGDEVKKARYERHDADYIIFSYKVKPLDSRDSDGIEILENSLTLNDAAKIQDGAGNDIYSTLPTVSHQGLQTLIKVEDKNP